MAFSSVARRDQVLADIQTQMAAQQTWGETLAVASTWPLNEPSLSVDVRFSAQPARQAIVNRIETFATGQRTPLAGSWYALHPCPHDETPRQPCILEPRRV